MSKSEIPRTEHKYDQRGQMIPADRYHIYSRSTGNKVGESRNLESAIKYTNRKDQEYGGSNHVFVPIYKDENATPHQDFLNSIDENRRGRWSGKPRDT